MKFKASKLSHVARCNIGRKHEALVSEDAKTQIYDEVGIKKNAVRKGLEYKNHLIRERKPYTSKEREYLKNCIGRLIFTEYENLEFPNKKTREMRARDAWKEVFRYVNDESNYCYFVPKRDLIIFGHEITDIAPDMVVVNKKTKSMRAVKWKFSRPKVTQDGDKEDASVMKCLELYCFLEYLKEMMPAGEEYVLEASYYYFRKTYMFDNEKKDLFDEVFFNRNEKGKIVGGNVVTLSQTYFKPAHPDSCLYNDDSRPCVMEDGSIDKMMCPYCCCCVNACAVGDAIDAHFKSQFEEFAKGKDSCDPEKDCKYCDFNHICNFTFAPEAIKKEVSAKPLSAIKLSKEQADAIAFRKGVARINAGAGAGKTLTMTLRVAQLIDEGVDPSKICMLTFTNSAADETKKRTISYCDDLCVEADVEELVSTTFNGFGNAVIMEHYEELGFEQEPRLIPDVTRSRIIANILNRDENITALSSGLDYKNFYSDMKTCMGALAMTKKIFGIIKNNDFSLADAQKVKLKLSYAEQAAITVPTIEKLFELYAEYDAELRSGSYIEFADQQFLLFELLKKDPTILESFGFEHIIVDEFQDTSEGQIQLVKELMNNKNFQSLMVVGDDSQAIYGFRDTTPDFIIHFERYIGQKVTDFSLLDNYRSTPQIIEFANKINKMNKLRVEKDLISKRAPGKPVVIRGFWDKKEERQYIREKIEEKINAGTSPEDIAYLAADATELQAMGSVLTEAGIPWIMLNPEKFLKNSRIIACLEFGKFYRQPSAVNSARVYLNAILKNTLFDHSDEDINNMVEELKERVEEIKAIFSPAEKVAAYLEAISAIDDSDEIFLSFLDNLKNYVSLDQMLDYCADMGQFGEKEALRRSKNYPGVVLSTAHSSKGLEWPIVFDSINKYDTEDVRRGKQVLIEEKRRLLFVSSTRAKDELYITGEYVAFGGAKNRVFNQYLMDCYEAAGLEFAPGEPPKKERKKEESAVKATGKSVRTLIQKKKAKTNAKANK